MTTKLEDDIRSAFAELAESTTIDSGARFGDRTAQVTELRPTTRRWVMPAAAAIAGLALVGALFATMRDTSTTAPLADQVLPAPVEPTLDGLFSTDDLDPAIIDGNDGPTIVASAYLDDRTRPEVLPADFPITYSLEGDDAVEYVAGSAGNQAVVRFELQLPEDSATGYLLLDQTAPANRSKRWVVTGAETTSFGVATLSLEQGVVSGSFTTEIGGVTEVTLFDATTGEALAPTLDVLPTETIDLENGKVAALLGRFEFAGLDADAVIVRLWNTNAQAGGSPVANFAERLVHGDSSVAFDGSSPISDLVN